MATSKPPEQWTVAECKTFLQALSVPCSGYQRQKLIQLVKKALLHPSLVTKLEPLEERRSNEVSEERRKIIVEGREVVFTDPFTLLDWKDDLRDLPPIDNAQVLLYQLNKRGWTVQRISAFENERGFQLHKDNHIQGVKCKVDGDFTYIKAHCVRQTSLRENPYIVWLLTTSRGTIEASGCQCTGDDDGCKHVVAMLFSVAEFIRLQVPSSTAHLPTCTDLPCTWNKPRRVTGSVKLVNIDARKDTSTPKPSTYHETVYDACIWKAVDDIAMDAELLTALQGTDAVLLQAFGHHTQSSC